MTKNLMTEATKFLLAFVLVIGGFNATATSAFAQELESEEVAVTEVTTVDSETTNVEEVSETVQTEQQELPAVTTTEEVVAPFSAFATEEIITIEDAKAQAAAELDAFLVLVIEAINADTTLTDEEKAAAVASITEEFDGIKAMSSMFSTVAEVQSHALMFTSLDVNDIVAAVLEFNSANNVGFEPILDPEVLAAQEQAKADIDAQLAKVTATVNSLTNMTDEEKAATIAELTLIFAEMKAAVAGLITIEEINDFVDGLTALTTDVIASLVEWDTAVSTAIVEMDKRLADAIAEINSLTSLDAETKAIALETAQEMYDVAVYYILASVTLEEIAESVAFGHAMFNDLSLAANLDNKIAAINARLDQATAIVHANPNLTVEQANAIIDSMNVIVEQANADLAAATTLEEMMVILDAAIEALNVILDSIIPPVVDAPVLTPVTPDEGATLPNTGLDNSSLFLSVTALMAGILALIVASKRNRNV